MSTGTEIHLARIASARNSVLNQLARMTMADHIAESLPKDVQVEIDEHDAGTSVATFVDATVHPVLRKKLRTDLEDLVTLLDDCIIGSSDQLGRVLSEDDLHLLSRFYETVTQTGTKTKRELSRFFDTLEASDSGWIVLHAHPGTKRTENRIDGVYFREMPCEDLKIHFPKAVSR